MTAKYSSENIIFRTLTDNNSGQTNRSDKNSPCRMKGILTAKAVFICIKGAQKTSILQKTWINLRIFSLNGSIS